MLHLTYGDVLQRAHLHFSDLGTARIYGVPRGGIHALHLALRVNPNARVAESPQEADVIVDDIIDSGSTRTKYYKQFPELPFIALVDKQKEGISEWVSFFWEVSANENGPQENIRRLLQFIGEDPLREGLLETPDRVVKSYAELFSGYKQEPSDIFKVFDGEKYDEIVLLRNIEFSSFCEHHMIPFLGEAHIAYIPNGKVIGLSKLARLLNIYARRLQIQERLTTQVTSALDRYLQPIGAACIVHAKHLCVSCRGVGKQESEMVTSSLTGVFKKELSARQELLTLIYGGK